jgi:hypothetical protein
MKEEQLERLVRMEANLDFIKEKLTEHIDLEATKYNDMEDRFADKEIEEVLRTTITKVNELPDNLSRRFAGLWVENWTKAVAFTVIGSVSISIILKFMW